MLILKLALEVIIFAANLSAFGALAMPLHLPDPPPGHPKNPWLPDLAAHEDVWVLPKWDDNVFDNSAGGIYSRVTKGGKLNLAGLTVQNLVGIWEQLGAVRSMWDYPKGGAVPPYQGTDVNRIWLHSLSQAELERLLGQTSGEICKSLHPVQWTWLFHDIAMIKAGGHVDAGIPDDHPDRKKEVDKVNKHMVDALERLAHQCHDDLQLLIKEHRAQMHRTTQH